MTDAEIYEETQKLAMAMAAKQSFEPAPGCDHTIFARNSISLQMVQFFELAVLAMEVLMGHEMTDVITEIEGEEIAQPKLLTEPGGRNVHKIAQESARLNHKKEHLSFQIIEIVEDYAYFPWVLNVSGQQHLRSDDKLQLLLEMNRLLALNLLIEVTK